MNKTKKNKRRCNYEKTMHTLDVCHEKKLEDFNKNYNGLNKLQKELKGVRKNIKKYNHKIMIIIVIVVVMIILMYQKYVINYTNIKLKRKIL